MARIVVAGAGAVGASVAYHLALLGANDVVLCDRATVASGATGKAMGGVRQQFDDPADAALVRAGLPLFRELGTPLFDPVGYFFVATTEEGWERLRERAERQSGHGVPVEEADPDSVLGLRTDDVLGAVCCYEDGVAEPGAVTQELVRRAAGRGVDVREHTDAREVEGDVFVVACGAASHEFGLAIRPLCRQLVDVGPVEGLPADLPMVLEAESGFHFRRRGETLRLAMAEPTSRWGDTEEVDDGLVQDWRARLAHRYPPAADADVVRAWAGLYDMTPDAHPLIGWVEDGVYAACGFSGHGFMQSPAVGRGVAEELLGLTPTVDLSPYRPERFTGEEEFSDELVL